MAFDRRNRLPLFLLILLAGLLLSLAIAARAAPRLVEVSPPPDSANAPTGSPIVLAFNRPMDAASVEARLLISPAVPGQSTWEGARLTFRPDEPWPAGTIVRVRLAAGARSALLLPVLSASEWSFTVGAPRLAYLWPAGAPAELYARSADASRTDQLTSSAHGVVDFEVSADGRRVLYAAARGDGGVDLWLLEPGDPPPALLYACPAGARCTAATLSPDGAWLALERHEAEPPGAGPRLAAGRIWLVRTADGAAAPLSPEQRAASMPLWSPDNRLAYFDGGLRAIVVVDPGPPARTVATFASELGPAGSWSPDGRYLVFPEIEFPEAGGDGATPVAPFYSHLLRAGIATGEVLELWNAAIGMVEDAQPTYSPDGLWIAFARRSLEPARWTLGRQLWLMRADGGGARPLTDEPTHSHSAFAWSPDSTRLAYMRFNEADPTQAAEIWWTTIEAPAPVRLVVGGYLPQWLP